MVIVFVLWLLIGLVFIGIGLYALRAANPVGFFTGIAAPKVKDARAYNRAVGKMWLVFGVVFCLLGLPLTSLEQNSPAALLLVLGTAAWAIALMITYSMISIKHQA